MYQGGASIQFFPQAEGSNCTDNTVQCSHRFHKDTQVHLLRRVPQLDLAAKRAWSKSISVIAIVAWYKINFIGLQLYRNESELIRIPGFVPFHICRVLLKIQPCRQNLCSRFGVEWQRVDTSGERRFGLRVIGSKS